MIHPEDKAKRFWDRFVLLMTTATAVEIPLRLALDLPLRGWWLAFDLLITAVFVIDLVLNFFTAVQINGVLVSDPKRVALHYLKGFFLIDLLAVLPFEALFGSGMVQTRMLRQLRLLRLFRLAHVADFMRSIAKKNIINASILRMIFLGFWVVLFTHWATCGWIALGAGNIGPVWRESQALLYLRSLYWAVTTIATIGYGDVIPITPAQTGFAIGIELLGAGIYGYVIAIFASLIARLDIARSQFDVQLEKVNTFMRFRKIPADLQERIRRYYEHLWTSRRGHDEANVLEDLPASLKLQVALHLSQGMIEKVPLFSGAGDDLVQQIVMNLKATVFTPGDYIFREGEGGDSMYFISRGRVEVVSKDGRKVYATLSEGNFFGEIALLLRQPRNASIRALDYVDLYMLDHETLEKILKNFPGFMEHIHDLARKRQAEHPPV